MAIGLPLVIGGVGIVRGSVKGLGPALHALSHEVSSEIQRQNLFSAAPFRSVSLIVKYGNNSIPTPQIGRINRHQELEVSTQASIEELRSARGNVGGLKSILEPYILGTLSAVCDKYGLTRHGADEQD